MPVDVRPDGVRQELEKSRSELVQGKTSLDALLKTAGLYGDASRLVYFMHRITPEENPMRFDTRFYIGCLPMHQNPLPQSEEVTESVWVTPREALERAARGVMPIIRPTRIVLKCLADFDSWANLTKTYSVE
jgi:hypothetical protein